MRMIVCYAPTRAGWLDLIVRKFMGRMKKMSGDLLKVCKLVNAAIAEQIKLLSHSFVRFSSRNERVLAQL